MDRLLKLAAVALIVAMLLVYVAAKMHFFTRYTGDLEGYLGEHWPYWAAMCVVAALLWLIGVAIQRRVRSGASERGSAPWPRG